MKVFRKKFFVQDAFNILSIISIVIATVSLVSVNNIEKNIAENKVLNQEKNKVYLDKKARDTEVINIDSDAEKINSIDNHEFKKIEFDNKDGEKNNIKDYNTEKNNINNMSDNDKLVVNKNTELEKIIPISRNGDMKTKINKKEGNKVKIKESDSELSSNSYSVNNKEVKKILSKREVTGDFVVQVSAFKNELQAEDQCRKIASIIGNKYCGVFIIAKNFYRSVVYPFNSREEAEEFSTELSEKLRIKCFVRMNV